MTAVISCHCCQNHNSSWLESCYQYTASREQLIKIWDIAEMYKLTDKMHQMQSLDAKGDKPEDSFNLFCSECSV